jgi:chromosome segregation ATPase
MKRAALRRGDSRMSNESEGNMGQTSLQLEQERDPLDSWKEIAAYLNRNVRTVQRWEKREGLPIHRHVHERASSVSAYKKEIDAWQKQRSRVSDEITENQRELEHVIGRLRMLRTNDERRHSATSGVLHLLSLASQMHVAYVYNIMTISFSLLRTAVSPRNASRKWKT